MPVFAAGLSAWGMLHTDLRYELAGSAVTPGGMPADAALRSLFDTLEHDGRGRMAGWRGGAVAAAVPPTCATASRCSRSPCRSMTWK